MLNFYGVSASALEALGQDDARRGHARANFRLLTQQAAYNRGYNANRASALPKPKPIGVLEDLLQRVEALEAHQKQVTEFLRSQTW